MNKTEVAKLFKKQRDISRRGLSMQYENTDLCRQFYNADSMNYRDQIQFADTMGRRRRAMVNFNKVQSNVDAVVGFMAQNRRQAKFVARLNSNDQQEQYSRDMNNLYSYHRENTNADQLETDQDADMMINGYGAIETDLSYIIGNATKDPNGSILKMRLDPKNFYWDPNCKNKNLIGARWKGYFEDFDLKEALDLFQGSKEEDFEVVDDSNSTSGDRGYVYNPWGGLYDKIKLVDSVEWVAKDEDMVRVYNHQWMSYETFYRAKNPLYMADNVDDAMFIQMRLELIQGQIKTEGPDNISSQDMFDFDPTKEELVFDEATKNLLVKEFGDLIDPIGFKRECYYTAVISGQHVFKWFKSISQQGFSIKVKTGIYNETGKFWQGMINSMMEPQKYYNKALTELLFTIASNSKGGVMVEEGAVEDISDFESKWAKTDAVIKVASGALSGGQIQEKAKAAVPTGLDNIIMLSDSAISAAGVDPAFIGQTNADETGILYKRRIRQVISKMARYFDSITLYQKEDARLMADLIRVWVQNNNGEDINIVGEDGRPGLLTISEDIMAPEYSVAIQEAPQTPEDKEQMGAGLQALGDKVAMIDPNAAKGIWAESMQFFPMDGDVRNRITKLLQPQDDMVPAAQVQQLEAVIQQLQSQLQQAQVAKLESETRYNEAKTAREMATTGKTLEESARTGLENDLIRSGEYETPTVNI